MRDLRLAAVLAGQPGAAVGVPGAEAELQPAVVAVAGVDVPVATGLAAARAGPRPRPGSLVPTRTTLGRGFFSTSWLLTRLCGDACCSGRRTGRPRCGRPGGPVATTLVSPAFIELSFVSTTGAANFSCGTCFVTTRTWTKLACSARRRPRRRPGAGPETATEVPREDDCGEGPEDRCTYAGAAGGRAFQRMHGARIDQRFTTEMQTLTPRCDGARQRRQEAPGRRYQGPPKAVSVLVSMAAQSASRSSLRRSARVRTVSGTR